MDLPSRLKGCSTEYFGNNYINMNLHEEMIRDRFIELTCKNGISLNKFLFKDKIVLDVNCGIGLLSIFLASVGAKTVIGIEPSHLAKYAEKCMIKNKVNKIVRIIHSKVEEIDSLPDGIEKVDVIVSQWMGYLLFDKSMLDTLIHARVRWLKPEGIMFPDCIRLFITAAEHEQRKQEILGMLRHKGFNMSPLKKFEFDLPRIEIIPPHQIVTDCVLLREINLKTVLPENFSFTVDAELTATRHQQLQAYVLFFEIKYSKCHKHLILSSSPYELYSRWKPIILCFENRLIVTKNEKVKCTFSMKHKKIYSKNLYLSIDTKFNGTFCETRFINHYVL